MCGIAGWLAARDCAPPSAALEAMATLLQHRGPDDSGFHRDADAGLALAHRRLSIIDLSAASHQPMTHAATGVVLVYNGELYNFRELRAELQSAGHFFESSGDAEVLLRSYLHWGMDCLQRFAGMFAFALWDPRSGVLHLARDPLGMKPLYYATLAGGIAFASEVKAFAAVPGMRMAVCEIGLAQFLEFGYVFDEHRTLLEGILKLPPGRRIEATGRGVIREFVYFTPPAADRADSRGEVERCAELLDVLGKTVRQHLVADVPVGLLLSGGLDSSLVAAIAARCGPLSTVSMGFDGSNVDERPQAREVARFIGSRHSEFLVTPAQVIEEASTGAWAYDDLFSDWGLLTTRILYRRCREAGLKVVLVGEGADELFGGYDRFRVTARLGLMQQIRLYRRYSGRRYGKVFLAFRAALSEFDRTGTDGFDVVRMFETQRQLPNQYAMKVDKASMSESVEARCPFLDRRVAELAFRTPREWLQRGGEDKYLLRALARRAGLLPEATSGRTKFGAPLPAQWMDGNKEFRNFAAPRLLEGKWTRRLGFDRAMRAFFNEGRSGDRFPRPISIFSDLAWRLLLLELWDDQRAV